MIQPLGNWAAVSCLLAGFFIWAWQLMSAIFARAPGAVPAKTQIFSFG
jgi:hypothetical protein